MIAPTFDVRAYGASLGDCEFWEPYVRTVLHRHGYAGHRLESGYVGTFPTFLTADVVVKLFGYFPSWRECHEVELAIHRLLSDRPGIPAPGLLANGKLYDNPEAPWPYLVTERLSGRAWRDAALESAAKVTIATTLGPILRAVHDLPLPGPGSPVATNWPLTHRPGAVDRHRRWRALPDRLIAQIDAYVGDLALDDAHVIHADLTSDHIFVEDDTLIGIIDWGDAMIADRHYELAALHLDLFAGDKAVLRAFLDAYAWPVDGTFPRRALSLALLHQFNVLEAIDDRLPLDEFGTLDELAVELFEV